MENCYNGGSERVMQLEHYFVKHLALHRLIKHTRETTTFLNISIWETNFTRKSNTIQNEQLLN